MLEGKEMGCEREGDVMPVVAVEHLEVVLTEYPYLI